MKRILACLALITVSACTDPEGARRTLVNNGYTNVQTTGRAWFSCGDKDSYATAFTATAPGGQKVSGAVCSGWLKGNTIRFD